MFDEPPGVALVGCGNWGRNIARVLSKLGALRAVADVDAQLAQRVADSHGSRSFDFHQILSDKDIIAVVIAAPAAVHYQLALEAITAGKHVLVEKPMALRLEDASVLSQEADARSQVLMVGHLMQYHPAFLRLKMAVADGTIGRLQYIYSHRLNLGRFRQEEDILWSFAPHDVSMILGLVGEDPNEVTAVGASFLREDIADVTTTHLAFPGGQRAHVFVSWLHPYKEQKLVVVGDSGMLVFDDGESWDSKLRLYPHVVHWQDGSPIPLRGDAESIPVLAAEPLLEECVHFLSCVRSGESPRTNAAEGIRVLRVLDAAAHSLSGRKRRDIAGPEALRDDVFIHESAYVDEGVSVSAGTRIWHFSHLMTGSQIGRDCTIGQNVMIGPRVKVGNGCKIQNNVSLYEGVELSDGVFCGPSCVFTNVINPRAEVSRTSEFQPTRVGTGATIGANATIVCGNQIGRYAFVAAGAVVTEDVSDFALVAGVPARRIGWMSRVGYRLGPDLVCPGTGDQYEEVDGELKECELPPHD